MSMDNEENKSPIFGQLVISGTMLVVVVLVLGFLTWAFGMKSIVAAPGEEVVLVDRPYFFGHEGIRDYTLKEGRITVFKSTVDYPVKTTPTAYPVPLDDFSSSDNILLDFETNIQMRITDPRAMMKNFGPDMVANNIRPPYIAIVREAVKKRTMSAMMSNPTAAQTLDNEITKGLEDLVKRNKLPVEIINVSLGRAKPNKNVLDQMNATAAEQQRNLTLVAATQAEKQRKAEQEAKADADNAYRLKMQLDTKEFVQIRQAEILADACKNGKNCVLSMGAASPVLINAK